MYYCFRMMENYNTKDLPPPPISSLLKINFLTLWIRHSHGWELKRCNCTLPLRLDKITWLARHYSGHLIYFSADVFFRNTTEGPRQTRVYGLSTHPELWKEIVIKGKTVHIGLYWTNQSDKWFAEKKMSKRGQGKIFIWQRKENQSNRSY